MEISVIIPVYNAAPFLETAVLSALAQPETSEVILVEDASTDDSLTICRTLERQNERVRLFQHPGGRNLGAGASRNLGVKMARFPFIAFLDADDYYLENRFMETAKAFREHPEVDGVYETAQRFFDSEEARKNYEAIYDDDLFISVKGTIPPADLFEAILLGKTGWIHLNALAVKKAFIEKTGLFDENLRQTQDTDLILRMALQGTLMPGNLAEPVAMVRIHGQNRILDTREMKSGKWMFYKKWLEILLEEPFSPTVNRRLVRRYLACHPGILKFEKSAVLRVLVKSVHAIYLLLRYPRLIGKIL
jgi:glycosyltransferase involved in cell wall biosynthesis